MNGKKLGASMFLLFSVCVTIAVFSLDRVPAFSEAQVGPQKASAVDFITAEELKAKLARNEKITIIDVRATSGYVNSDDRIKGAIHFKLRRLKSRLSLPPLRNVPRDSEVVTYCACPRDESSVQAAQILIESGFKRVRVLKGGWQGWLSVNGQVEPRPKA